MAADGNIESRVRALIDPLLDDLNVDLYDLEFTGGRLKVTVDTPEGIDSGLLYLTTRAISREMDETDPIPGGYTLEISSPGLERKLRVPEHFTKAVGEDVSMKVSPDFREQRRFKGRITAADATSVTVEPVNDAGETMSPLVVPLTKIQKATTIFEWGPTPKPGGPKGSAGSGKSANKTKPTSSAKDASTTKDTPNGSEKKAQA